VSREELAQDLLEFARAPSSGDPTGQVTSVNGPIYLDYSATTPVDPRVAKAMIPFLFERFGNPASRSHSYGWDAEQAVECARAQVAALVGADPKEIVWTSGRDRVEQSRHCGRRALPSREGSPFDHDDDRAQGGARHDAPSGARGIRSQLSAAAANGLLDLERFAAAIRPDTVLASVMHVNNEIGVIQDLAAIGDTLPLARRAVSRRCGPIDRQGRDRPRIAAGGSDVVLGAQDLRPQRASARFTCGASRACASRH
jgi:hypothetical protein